MFGLFPGFELLCYVCSDRWFEFVGLDVWDFPIGLIWGLLFVAVAACFVCLLD